MDFRVSNVETEDELKQRAREYVLERVCEKYRRRDNSEFTVEEMEKMLGAFDERFLRSRIRDLLKGSGVIEFTDGDSLRLTESGKKHCQEQDKGT